jgi:hypothetical protein
MSKSMAGWIGFAGILMLIVGSIDVVQGLIALFEDDWFTIIAVSVNFLVQLGFLGNSSYPLWTLTALALNVIVLYALTARWSESEVELRTAR